MRTPIGAGAGSALVLVAAILSAGCTGGDDDVSPTTSAAVTTTTTIVREADGILKIGLYLPQTGPGAALGEPMIAAAVDTIETINDSGGVLGSDVEYEILDEGGSSTGPTPLLDLGVDAIVGPASSRDALAQLGLLTGPNTPVVTCSPTASARSLDAYPDNGYFFRTVPSDTLQMTAIERRAERTGVATIAVGFLDDPYGRALADALIDEVGGSGRLTLVAEAAFGADQENLSSVADELLAPAPGVVVVLGDADDGGRLLSALDTAIDGEPPALIVNDSIRTAAAIQQLSDPVRSALTGVAPLATSEAAPLPFTAHTIDCVNLIALAAEVAGSDAPNDFRIRLAPVSGGGRQCTSFATCIALIDQRLEIDYNGLSGPLELSTVTGDPTRASFTTFGFGPDGAEIDPRPIDVTS